jgi:hypothetical protein
VNWWPRRWLSAGRVSTIRHDRAAAVRIARGTKRSSCGEKPAYSYRRVVWWLWRHHGLVVNGKQAWVCRAQI